MQFGSLKRSRSTKRLRFTSSDTDTIIVKSESNKQTIALMKEQVRQKLFKLRKWEFTTLGRLYQDSGQFGCRTIDGGTKFTILSYNVLAPTLLNEHQNYLYKNVDPDCLNWKSRYELFIQELSDLGFPDILCFQEVEATFFLEFYEIPLAKLGYQGIYKKRTGDKVDGCAIFWKESLFTMTGSIPVEYHQPHIPLLDRDNIALLVKLQSKIGKRPTLVVGTTHLLFNPKRSDVKLAQVQLILSELDRFAFCGFNKGEPTYHPIILTGDFNTEPRSSIVRLITDGEITYPNQNGKLTYPNQNGGLTYPNQNGELTYPNQNGKLTHPSQDDERPKVPMKKGRTDFIPNYVGISDQCQHYRIVLERYNQWMSHRRTTFELDIKDQEKLINLYSSEISTIAAFASSSTSLIPQQITSDLDPITHAKIINDLSNAGTVCTFGTGELSHKMRMCNIYQSKLDCEEYYSLDSIATTKQAQWVCVDYIFYSKLWSEQYGRRVEGNLKLLRRLGLLNRSKCNEMGRLPSYAVSSDHYPLLAEFVLQ